MVLSCVTLFLVQPLLVRFCRKLFAPSSPVYISEKEYPIKNSEVPGSTGNQSELHACPFLVSISNAICSNCYFTHSFPDWQGAWLVMYKPQDVTHGSKRQGHLYYCGAVVFPDQWKVLRNWHFFLHH